MILCGISGSLRKGSFNHSLLEAAKDLAPTGTEIRIFGRLGEIPLYNQDLEAQGIPEPVAAFKQAIANADGLLIATPEYNYSVPGVLKNAIDWASRPPKGSPLQGKPVALMGATPGMGGTARGQSALRQSFVFTQSQVMTGPEFLMARAHEKFDEQGKLKDEASRKMLASHLENFAVWVRRLAGS
jgi:chromate reductase